MNDKPVAAAGYPAQSVELVRSTCLYVATVLGDLRDDPVVVGGLVPSLLIPPHQLPESVQPHVGTMDLDIGLAVAVLEHERYRTLVSRAIGALSGEPRPARSEELLQTDLPLELRRIRLAWWRILCTVSESRRIGDVLAVRRRPPYDGDLPGRLRSLS